MQRYTGFDPKGIARVHVDHTNDDICETKCKRAAIEYVAKHPEARPVTAWSFTHRIPRIKLAGATRSSTSAQKR